jgi:hypothetical protein
MLRPKALRTGDLVAVVATSGGLGKDEMPLFDRTSMDGAGSRMRAAASAHRGVQPRGGLREPV